MEFLRRISASWRHALFALLRSAGPIPRHVAFIMDGNRRFATRRHIHRYLGHQHGCEKVQNTLQTPSNALLVCGGRSMVFGIGRALCERIRVQY